MALRSRQTFVRAAVTLLAATLATSAHASQVDELIADGIVRSFASAADQANAEPSVAIVGVWPAQGTAPAGFGPLPAFSSGGGLQTVTVLVDPGTNLYATGSQSGPMERVGRRVEYYNLDNFAWGDFSNRNYQTHPWVLGVRADGTAFGVLFDSTWASSLDTQRPYTTGIVFQTEGASPRVVTINGATPQEVVKKLSDLTGRPFMPPMWSLGYHQSKYSYTPQSYALSIAQEFRNRSIPAEVLWLDIDYMDGFRNFTFNSFDFPNPGQLNADLESIGFQAVWMANCGMKVDGGYGPYQDIVAGDLATKRSDGVTDYIARVWPGDSVWPDFTMQATRDWWADEVRDFATITIPGIDGIWNDMNEPAVFDVGSKTMPDNNWHRADAALGGPDIHRRYHNIYGMQMSKATREGMLAAFPAKRPFVLTRAGYMGGQRYAAMWTGDNIANWYHVDVSIQNVLNIGLSGQPNCGPDIGGFNGDSGALMYARWMGVGALMPFARGHYGFANTDREPWSYGADCEDTCRLALNRRYRLLNYLYTQFHEAHQTGLPVARPLFFAEPANPDLRFWDNGFLVGPGLLVAAATTYAGQPQVPPMQTPIYRLAFGQTNAPGAPLDTVDPDLPDLYVLGGHIVVANEIVQTSKDLTATRTEPIELIVALDDDGNATGTFYEDDGDGFGYQSGSFMLATFAAQRSAGDVTVSLDSVQGAYTLLPRDLTIRVLLGGGAEATFAGSTAALPITVPVPATTPDAQPDPNLRDGRRIRDAFGPQRLLATNDGPRWAEISQLRAMYARPVEDGIEVGLEGELAIDGTAIALLIDAQTGGQSAINTSALNPPPGGLRDLTGTQLDAGFLPDRMLFANAFDGNVFCDWVTLNAGSNGSKTYLGRQLVGSGGAALSGGTNPDGIEVALGSAGHAAGSGFEIFLPFSAIGNGVGPDEEIKLFAMIVKGDGQVTPQTLPSSNTDWPGYAPDFTALAGDQFATLSLIPSPCVGDVDGDGDTDVFDFAELAVNFGAGPGATLEQGDVTGDGFVDVFDFAELAADFGCPGPPS